VVTANGAYLHSRYTQFPTQRLRSATGLFKQNLDFSGNTIVRSPKCRRPGVSQQVDTPWDGQFEIAADAYWIPASTTMRRTP